MTDRVDKSMGIVTLVDEALSKINTTEPSKTPKIHEACISQKAKLIRFLG